MPKSLTCLFGSHESSVLPKWLPPQLSFSGSSYKNDLTTLYAIYERDFVTASPVTVDGCRVIVNNKPDPSWNGTYTYGFTHVITRGDRHRGLDYDRAKKLPWIRAVLENYKQPEVVAFWYRQPNQDRLYLWLQELDFIIILTPLVGKRAASTSDRIIVTAYSVDPHRRYDFEKLRKNAFKVL